jgi:hypothetical protein
MRVVVRDELLGIRAVGAFGVAEQVALRSSGHLGRAAFADVVVAFMEPSRDLVGVGTTDLADGIAQVTRLAGPVVVAPGRGGLVRCGEWPVPALERLSVRLGIGQTAVGPLPAHPRRPST